MPGRTALSLLQILLLVLLITPLARGDEREDSRARRRTPVVEVFEVARDAVVNISASEVVMVRGGSPFDSFFDDLFDRPRRSPRTRQFTRSSVGSGFIIHPEGYVVTNAHVVACTAEQQVILADGREYDAQIVAIDEGRDLAVLKVAADRSLPTLPLGRSDDLMIGETVIAIGNPLGFQHTVTAGVVSATEREVAISPELSFTGLIQTDASINPGNSGGPLLNVLGELIGVNTAIRGDAQNIGFAIPVNQLREVLPELLDVERRYRIESGLVVDYLAEPQVITVRSGSPAERAGLRTGDVLLAVNSRPIRKGIDYDIALINRKAGDVLDLTIRRDRRQMEMQLRLDARPLPDGTQLARQRLGVDVFPLPADAARKLGLSGASGLLVAEVERGGPGDDAGLESRDVLLSVGRQYITTVEELGQLLEQLDAGEVVQIRVLRLERRGKIQRYGPIRVR